MTSLRFKLNFILHITPTTISQLNWYQWQKYLWLPINICCSVTWSIRCSRSQIKSLDLLTVTEWLTLIWPWRPAVWPPGDWHRPTWSSWTPRWPRCDSVRAGSGRSLRGSRHLHQGKYWEMAWHEIIRKLEINTPVFVNPPQQITWLRDTEIGDNSGRTILMRNWVITFY